MFAGKSPNLLFMFKRLFFIGLFMTLSYNTYSQQFSYGPKIGLNISTISAEDDETFSSRIGFTAGLMAEIKLSDKFSLQPEALYSTQGSKASDDYFQYDNALEFENVIVKLDYIHVPILAEYYITPGLSAQFGPQISFLVNSKLELDLTYEGVTEFRSNSIDEQIRDVDFGICGGFEYVLDNGILFNLRYNLGLRDFVLGADGGLQGDNKNRVIQFSAGYKF